MRRYIWILGVGLAIVLSLRLIGATMVFLAEAQYRLAWENAQAADYLDPHAVYGKEIR